MNAKKELLSNLKDLSLTIKCAEIKIYDKILFIKKNHTKKELETFLNSLDFDYDNGYGGQELFGIVWLSNNTWLTRGEYDGSEWWEHHELPEIPDYLF